MSGVYEPGLEVGNSAFPLATIQSHSQRVLKERLGNVIQLCRLKENYMNVVILFPTGCCCLPDLAWTLLSLRVIWQQLGPKSSLPSPLPHPATGGWVCPDQVRPELVPGVAPDLPNLHPSLCDFMYLSFGSIYPLVLTLDSFFISACLGSCSNTTLTVMPSSWPLMSITTDSVSSSISVSYEE